jgi:hypothetical protein
MGATGISVDRAGLNDLAAYHLEAAVKLQNLWDVGAVRFYILPKREAR